ncbi:hypothetical protein CDL15_Pgr018393 [Punica granatum]|uniref:Uncharacterized protein n=1 Tax=Punica granatum TaxID=22663 RepID=A0A218W219_PUNGR|nr:hypothetical protein CDL15_Pgr018393 [Punica granatum]
MRLRSISRIDLKAEKKTVLDPGKVMELSTTLQGGRPRASSTRLMSRMVSYTGSNHFLHV